MVSSEKADLADPEEGLYVLAVQLQNPATVAESQLRLALSEVAEREVEVQLLERGPPDCFLFVVSESHCLQLPHCLSRKERRYHTGPYHSPIHL